MSVADVIYLVVFVFVIAIVGVLIKVAADPIISSGHTVFDNVTGGNASMNVVDTITDATDFIVVGIAFGGLLFAIISAWLVQSHPFFIFPTIIFGAIALFFSPLFANAYGSFIQSPGINSTVNTDFPMTTALMQFFPFFILGAFILIGIVLLAKPGGRSG